MAKNRKLLTFYDSSQEKRSTVQNIAYIIAHVMNLVQGVITLYMCALLFQTTGVGYTYHKAGQETCQLFYNLGLNRFFFFAFAVANIPDFKCSINIGKELGGVLCVVISFLAGAINLVLVAVCIFYYYGFVCNVNGFGGRMSICQDDQFCGITGFFNNTLNACNMTNPFNLPLNPVVAPPNLKWNHRFIQVFIGVGIMTVFSFIKGVANLTLPNTTSEVNDITKAFGSSGGGGSSGRINGEFNLISRLTGSRSSSSKKKKKSIQTNLFEKRKNFFTFWKKWHVTLFILVLIGDYLLTGALVAWFGWFVQDVESALTRYKLHPTIIGSTIVETDYIWFNVVFYAVFGLTIWFNAFTSRLGQMFSNGLAIIGAMCGAALVAIQLIIGFLTYTLNCNKDNHPFNICSMRCWYCSLFHANPMNAKQCTDYLPAGSFPCLTQCEGVAPPVNSIWIAYWDWHYIIFVGIMVYALVSFLVTLVTAGILQNHFGFIKSLILARSKKDVRKNFSMIRSTIQQGNLDSYNDNQALTNNYGDQIQQHEEPRDGRITHHLWTYMFDGKETLLTTIGKAVKKLFMYDDLFPHDKIISHEKKYM